jgi:exodeoxyribonuclease VII small subunit
MARQPDKGVKVEKGGPGAEGAPEPYDKLVERLETVVGELEAGTLTLEQSIEKFAEGVKLARDAARKLEEAERRVEGLLRAEDGSVQSRPLEGEEGER